MSTQALLVAEEPPSWRPSAGTASTTRAPRLLDRVRAAIRERHYSRRTEEAYVGWIRRFILYNGKRHPSEMGRQEVARFLSSLAVEARVSAGYAERWADHQIGAMKSTSICITA